MAAEPQGNPWKQRFGPSDELMAMFRAGSIDPTKAIQTRLEDMLQTFLRYHRDNAGNEEIKELAAKSCLEAGTWYYRILEKQATQERKRLGISDITGIFGNDLLQRCLVACTLEMTIFKNGLQCDFPLLLQILKLAPYHFFRVIESVLRAEEGLPPSSVRHLAQVEEKVLESLAWTRDSPLWDEIRSNTGRLPTCEQAVPWTWLEDPRSQTDRTLPGGSLSSGGGPSASPDQQPSAVKPRRSNSFHLFARKVYMLMAKRLSEMCPKLKISKEQRGKIWTCFEHSLVHCTDLMVDRHLNQLLLCAIYIIPKVCKNVLISRGILGNTLIGTNNNGDHIDSFLTPDTPSEHYPGPAQEERDNLFVFFNQVYSPKMQDFALQFESTRGVDTPPLSPYPQLKAIPRRRRLPLETDSSRSANRASCVALSLDSEEMEEGEDAPSLKRLCLESPSALERRLRNVQIDRETQRDQTAPVTKPNLR